MSKLHSELDRENLVFAGTPEFAARMLRALLEARAPIAAVLTQPDRPKGRGRGVIYSPVKTLALEAQLPVLQPQSLKNPELWPELATLKATRFIVAAYGLILPKAVLAIPSKGCLNVHASLLPRWRGAAPLQRALLAGDKESGICLMEMEAGLDTGAILAQSTLQLENTETYGSLHEHLCVLGSDLLISYLKNPRAFGQPIIQNSELATYADKIQKQDLLINWQNTNIEIERQIRAFSPEPSAYTIFNKQNIKIHQARVHTGEPYPKAIPAIPGTVLEVLNDALAVATGAGTLLITHIQFPGKNALSILDLNRTRTLTIKKGMLLG
jgi:methionyl-tRNA formyltransferase